MYENLLCGFDVCSAFVVKEKEAVVKHPPFLLYHPKRWYKVILVV